MGAPAGTPVGTKLAQDVDSGLDINAAAIIAQGLRQDDELTVLDARTLVAGQPVSEGVENFTTTQETTNTARATSLALLGAKTANGTAWNLDLETVNVTPTQTLAQRFTEIGAKTDSLDGSVQTLNEVVLTTDGAATARSLTEVKAGGTSGEIGIVSGLTKVNADGTTSRYSKIALEAGITYVLAQDGTILAQFESDGDVAVIDNLRVSLLKVNTAVVPVRGAGSSSVTGSWSGTPTGGWRPLGPVEVVSLPIVLPVAGWIEVNATGKQDFASGLALWKTECYLNGNLIQETQTGGGAIEDSFVMQGSVEMAAGTYAVSYRWQAQGSVTLSNRSLFAKCYPNTE